MTRRLGVSISSVMVSHPLLPSQSIQAETDTGKGGGFARIRYFADSFTSLQSVIAGVRSPAVEARRTHPDRYNFRKPRL